MFIRYRPHHASHRQTIEIVVDKDEHAESGGGKQRGAAAPDLGGRPFAVGDRTSGQRDDIHQSPEQGTENDDGKVDLVQHGAEHGLHRPHNVGFGARTHGIDNRSGKNADKQGGKDLLADKRQRDGDNRGKDGKPSGIIGVHVSLRWEMRVNRRQCLRAKRPWHRIRSKNAIKKDRRCIALFMQKGMGITAQDPHESRSSAGLCIPPRAEHPFPQTAQGIQGKAEQTHAENAHKHFRSIPPPPGIHDPEPQP